MQCRSTPPDTHSTPFKSQGGVKADGTEWHYRAGNGANRMGFADGASAQADWKSRYCFKRLPFEITSTPEIFQRKMQELLQDHEGTVIYMDDILMFGASMKEHDRNLRKVMDTIHRDLDRAHLRCQRLLIRLMKFNPVAEFVPGKNLIIPDTLSRHPQPIEDDTGLDEDVQAYVDAVEEQERNKPVLECIREETEKDDSL
ncbi:hypothetical protein D5F01_LYC15598 [Larimichthys crocea]|uniref:ribonuclease H n=1 Tax=Larimichthys crocea TaxID=215358 RepID=A0A6G0I377_LARCR|nr:hypothetical protein D5F01_LYC15598 [Larimichthys crocea]